MTSQARRQQAVEYAILHHVPGRIRIAVPSMRKLSLSRLQDLSKIEVPSAISGLKPNPLTGTVVINYDPKRINIISFLNELSTNPVLVRMLQ